MNIKSLEIFVSVASELNMTSVAGQFFMSQSAVSQTIMELERELGVKLFDRINKRISLTEYGKIYLPYAKKILSIHDESLSKLKGINPVRIGASTSIGIYIMPELIGAFNTEQKSYDISLKIGNTDSILEMLLENSIDIAFVEGNVIDSRFCSEKIWKDEIVFISSCRRFKNSRVLTTGELSSEDFIIRETGSGTRAIIEEKLMAKKIKLNIRYEFGNTEAIKQAVISDMGISAVSRITIKNELSSGRICSFTVKGLTMERYFHLVSLKDRPSKKTLITLTEFCRKYSIR